MPKKIEGGYACSFCGKVYYGVESKYDALTTTGLMKAQQCEDGHQLIYVPFTKEELSNLILFFYTREEKLISPTMYERMKKIVNKR